MMVEFEGEEMRPSELVAKLEAKRARTCQDCGLEDPSLIVGSCLGCISEKKGYDAARADIAAWLRAQCPDSYVNGVARAFADSIDGGETDGFVARAK
jgi:hypothetical protein